jgi:hypothetical protein
MKAFDILPYFKFPYVLLVDYCDNVYKCLDNVCDFYGGCVKGCVAQLNRGGMPMCDCLEGYFNAKNNNTCMPCSKECKGCVLE